jgi:hypothetical protein
MDLLKWIKGMPGVAIALTKSTGFNLTMSSSNLKKQPARKSKFKENRSIMNQSQSHISKSLISKSLIK